MLIDHKERLLREPRLRAIANWPELPIESIPKNKRAGFRNNWRAVKLALDGDHYETIQQATGVHPTQITRLLKRALSADENDTPPLSLALIPGKRLKPDKRRIPLSSLEEPRGAKGSFQYLLDHVPKLRENLDKILKPYIDKSRYGENITAASFFEYFKLFLEQANHPTNVYPYTEDDLGYQSARLYMHARLDELRSLKMAKNQPKRVLSPKERPFEVGREIQLDEQTYDGESSVYLELSGNLVPVRIARFSLVGVSDADSTCVLSFRLAFTQHCSQYDVIGAMEDATYYSEPVVLRTPGLHVRPGPCFPNQLGEDFARIAFSSVALDNALAHCADTVEGHVCERHKGTYSLGLAGAPTTRGVIESAFNLLTRNAKRHKSTSGSHPNDPLRESSSHKKRPPVVTVFELEEAIYAVLARHNTSPKPYLMGSTPLEVYEYMMRERPLRLLPEYNEKRMSPFELKERVYVHWYKDEGRTPHINFYGCRYKGSCLAGQENTWVTVIFDYRDIRQLKVLTDEGEIVGTICAPKSWQHFSHGIKTRQYITKYCRMKRRRMKDPLVEYFWLQLQRNNTKRGSLEMLRLYREYSGIWRPGFANEKVPDQADADAPEDVSGNTHSVESEDTDAISVPPWSPEMVKTNREDSVGR